MSTRENLRTHRLTIGLIALWIIGSLAPRPLSAGEPSGSHYAEIRVVDQDSGRGVPLVELETVNGLLFITDNAGRVAFDEPGLMERELYLSVKSHGYEGPRDGFGFVGVRVTPRVGTPAVIRVKRTQRAERLCRLTGEGLYRDSQLLGYEPPLATSPARGLVAGQDSIQAVAYRGKLFCLWGDTQQMKYPLGLFRVAAATLPLPERDFDPAQGLSYDYFTDPATGFARAMMPLEERREGVVWLSGLVAVPDEQGQPRLVAHYTRRKGLADELEQGVALYDDERGRFDVATTLPLDESWRRPSGHAIHYQDDDGQWILFGSPNPNVRVPATFAAVLDPARYEALTCIREGSSASDPMPDLGDEGRPLWRWQRSLPPVTSEQEARWVKDGRLEASRCRFYPASAGDPAEQVQLHSGTVRWNPYRKKWLLLAGQLGGKASLLGEVWYAEADSPTGPFTTATHVVTHERQTFYNVCHHGFLDREGGRFIHFEGTYTREFSGNPHRTPRYDYNQVMYRLDLERMTAE